MQLLGLVGSLIGLFVSVYIYRKKRAQKPLMCPRNAPCDTVIKSSYSTTFGVPNEVLGMGYYSIVGVIHALIFWKPGFVGGYGTLVLVLTTCIGVLMSLYFVAVQAFALRAWCLWCLGSAFANVLLAIALFHIPMTEFFALLAAHRLWWIIIHNIGFILGLGGATITDVLFFKFLSDGVISEQERKTMDAISSVIWVGLGILFLSGLMLYLPEQARLNDSPKFLLKVIVVTVIALNGVALNLFVAPRLRDLSVSGTIPKRAFRRVAFALGGVSIVSWYTAFFLGSIRKIHPSFEQGLMIYGAILVFVVIGAEIHEHMTARRIFGKQN